MPFRGGRAGLVRAELLVLALALSGCYIEAAGSYYPVVDGGDRVADSGYGFSIAMGIALKVKRVRGSLGKGGDVVAVDYEDATGPGKAGHMAGFWTARVDYMAKKLAGKSFAHETWLDVTAGSFFGYGLGAVEYDDSLMLPESQNNPGYRGASWSSFSAYAGPSIHFSEGQEGDYILTLAPAMVQTDVASQEPFRAYGGQVRLVISLGIDPPAVDWGNIGIVRLMRHGGGNTNLEDDLRRHNRGQERHEERRKEEKKRQKKCKEQGQC
jgi:hypothetical protein